MSLSSNEVTSIHQDRNGQFWIGTFGGGLNRFNPQEGIFQVYKGNSSQHLKNLTILSIYEDSRGILWLTTSLEGVVSINTDTNEYTYYQDDPDHPDGMIFNDVLAILEDHTGAIFTEHNIPFSHKVKS